MNDSTFRISSRDKSAARVLLFSLFLLGFGFLFCELTNARAHSPADSHGVPFFRIGEQLRYRVDWQRYAGAAYAELDVVDRGNFFGEDAWHFRASVHTAEPARALFPVDDEADSYARLAGLASFRFREHFDEAGKPEDTYAELISSGDVSDARWTRIIVPEGTHDPVSAVYSLRQMDWRLASEVRIPVYDGDDLYEMVARSGGTEEVSVEAGKYIAKKITIRLLESGREVPGEHFTLWLANDTVETPVRLDAQLPLGNFRVELTSGEQAQNRENAVSPLRRSSLPAGN
ncbi:MAG TPA: DUF3108 domain-containing protein [Candidatus Acidoferrales bacterium]|nr:DUF3108 domain-containing protein [Candidatus Acidoferrales bacterium]